MVGMVAGYEMLPMYAKRKPDRMKIKSEGLWEFLSKLLN
jgi:hypothetical protein